jgi:hypothetical protein
MTRDYAGKGKSEMKRIDAAVTLIMLLAALCGVQWGAFGAPGCGVRCLAERDPFALMRAERVGPLRIGMTAGDVQKLLGKPQSRSKDEESPVDGLEHQVWAWAAKGIRLDMVTPEKGGEKTIAAVTVTAPCRYETARKIRIGSSRASVMKAYGKDIDRDASDKDTITAGSPYGGLVLSLSGEKVTRIFLGAAAE